MIKIENLFFPLLILSIDKAYTSQKQYYLLSQSHALRSSCHTSKSILFDIKSNLYKICYKPWIKIANLISKLQNSVFGPNYTLMTRTFFVWHQTKYEEWSRIVYLTRYIHRYFALKLTKYKYNKNNLQTLMNTLEKHTWTYLKNTLEEHLNTL